MKIDWKFWPIARIFKGVFTISFVMLAFSGKDWFFIVPALYFGIQTVYNIGCGCYSGACEVPVTNKVDLTDEK